VVAFEFASRLPCGALVAHKRACPESSLLLIPVALGFCRAKGQVLPLQWMSAFWLCLAFGRDPLHFRDSRVPAEVRQVVEVRN
jgi:hypothetical protein